MTTKIDIYEKLINAKKTNNKLDNIIYTMIWSDIQTYTKLGEVTPEKVEEIIKRHLKQSIETCNFFKTRNKDGDNEKIKEFNYRIAELRNLLPPQYTESELEHMIGKFFDQNKEIDFSLLIKESMKLFGDKSDKTMISQVCRKIYFRNKKNS